MHIPSLWVIAHMSLASKPCFYVWVGTSTTPLQYSCQHVRSQQLHALPSCFHTDTTQSKQTCPVVAVVCPAAVDLGAAANAQGFTITDDAGRGAPTSGSQTQGAAITGAGERSITISPALDLILGTGTGLRDGAAGLGRMRAAGIGESWLGWWGH
jgi:hypothetical protein